MYHVCVGVVVGGRVIYHWTNAGLWGVLVEVGVSRGRALSARMVLLLK